LIEHIYSAHDTPCSFYVRAAFCSSNFRYFLRVLAFSLHEHELLLPEEAFYRLYVVEAFARPVYSFEGSLKRLRTFEGPQPCQTRFVFPLPLPAPVPWSISRTRLLSFTLDEFCFIRCFRRPFRAPACLVTFFFTGPAPNSRVFLRLGSAFFFFRPFFVFSTNHTVFPLGTLYTT